MRILLIEDDFDLREMYAAQLLALGHQVEVAGNAQAALDSLEAASFDLVLLDIMLPQHNGISVLYEMRSYDDWKELPVVILSNILPHDLGITPALQRQLGIRDYLVKARTTPEMLNKAIGAL